PRRRLSPGHRCSYGDTVDREMKRLILLLVVIVEIALPAQEHETRTIITKTTRMKPGVIARASSDLDHAAMTIRGSNMTVDFTGVTLRGGPASADPDTFTGLAVLVDGGENVTIRNLTARGYKVGILARHTRRLHVTGADLSYNWKARLYSLVEHE